MHSEFCKYDYFDRASSTIKIVEDNHGNLIINDYSSLSDIPFTDLYFEKDFHFPKYSMPNKTQSRKRNQLKQIIIPKEENFNENKNMEFSKSS